MGNIQRYVDGLHVRQTQLRMEEMVISKINDDDDDRFWGLLGKIEVPLGNKYLGHMIKNH